MNAYHHRIDEAFLVYVYMYMRICKKNNLLKIKQMIDYLYRNKQ